ncbi:LysR substrate-binding domain-containing protein [Nonomuraea sp. NPDC050786]|uniref:LysR family transcriptional regulator n=1 Tax=Nonomuraea sp. NPDC050786 TaxID=3154840 RepID=UPI00340DD4A0
MAHDLEIADLRSFATVVRAGSITRAAHALQLSQPAVSQRIHRLERAAGDRLLVRDARGTRITPAGEKLLAYAERMLALHDEARASIDAQGDQATGSRTVGLLEDLAVTTLPTTLADFAALHPGIDLEVVIGPAQALRERAEHGRLDLALGDPSVMPDAAVRWRRRVPLAWAAAASLDPALDPLPLVMFSMPCHWRAPVLDALNQRGRRWRIAFQSTSLAAVQAAICAGIGVGTLLAGNVPAHAVRLGSRHDLPPAPQVEIAITRRPGTENDAAVDSLERLLRQSVAADHGA